MVALTLCPPASAAQADAAACHAGTENTLGPSNSKGVEPAASKAETTAGSSATQQRIEKPHEVISFEAAKEVRTKAPLHCCILLLVGNTLK